MNPTYKNPAVTHARRETAQQQRHQTGSQPPAAKERPWESDHVPKKQELEMEIRRLRREVDATAATYTACINDLETSGNLEGEGAYALRKKLSQAVDDARADFDRAVDRLNDKHVELNTYVANIENATSAITSESLRTQGVAKNSKDPDDVAKPPDSRRRRRPKTFHRVFKDKPQLKSGSMDPQVVHSLKEGVPRSAPSSTPAPPHHGRFAGSRPGGIDFRVGLHVELRSTCSRQWRMVRGKMGGSFRRAGVVRHCDSAGDG